MAASSNGGSTARLLLETPQLAVNYERSMEALDHEWEQDQEKTNLNCKCKIITKSVDGKIAVVIQPERKDLDVEKLGSVYRVLNSKILSEETDEDSWTDNDSASNQGSLKASPPKSYLTWKIHLFPSGFHIDAPIWGLVDDTEFGSDLKPEFTDKVEDGIRLKCIAEDITGKRHREVLTSMRGWLQRGRSGVYFLFRDTWLNFNSN